MRTVLLPLVAVLLATGCDVISPPYTEESPADTGTAGAFVQKVLLEDYTGFRCGNCPEAHERAQELQARYPGRVILMSVHAGFFARPAAPAVHVRFSANPVANRAGRVLRHQPGGESQWDGQTAGGYPGKPHPCADRLGWSRGGSPPRQTPPVALSLEARLDTSRWELTITARVRYRERGTPERLPGALRGRGQHRTVPIGLPPYPTGYPQLRPPLCAAGWCHGGMGRTAPSRGRRRRRFTQPARTATASRARRTGARSTAASSASCNRYGNNVRGRPRLNTSPFRASVGHRAMAESSASSLRRRRP
jgi:hypothetical protein